MKDVIFEGKWRKNELLNTEETPFQLIPTGTLFKIVVKTTIPTLVRLPLAPGSEVTAQSQGENGPAELWITEEFRSGDSFPIEIDEEAAAIEKVTFIFDEE